MVNDEYAICNEKKWRHEITKMKINSEKRIPILFDLSEIKLLIIPFVPPYFNLLNDVLSYPYNVVVNVTN